MSILNTVVTGYPVLANSTKFFHVCQRCCIVFVIDNVVISEGSHYDT